MSDNLLTVQHIYSCFAQGDIPGILAKLSDEVTFFNGSDPKVAPFGGVFKGKDGVINFFTALGGHVQTTHFEPSNFREVEGKIVNDVRHDGIIQVTGKSFSVQVNFSWTFNDDGEVIDWKGTGDFSSINTAFLN